MMKCWLSEWLDFLFPEPVEVDMDGDIPSEPTDSDPYLEVCGIPRDILLEEQGVVERDFGTPACPDAESVPEKGKSVLRPDTKVPGGSLPDIPEFYLRNIPVLEPDTMTPKSADAYVRSRR